MDLADSEVARLLEANKRSLTGPGDQPVDLEDAERAVFGAPQSTPAPQRPKQGTDPQGTEPAELAEPAEPTKPQETQPGSTWVDDGLGIATNRADGDGITGRMIRQRREFDRLPGSVMALFKSPLL